MNKICYLFKKFTLCALVSVKLSHFDIKILLVICISGKLHPWTNAHAVSHRMNHIMGTSLLTDQTCWWYTNTCFWR